MIDGTTIFGAASLIGVSLDADDARLKLTIRELSVKGRLRAVGRIGEGLRLSEVGSVET